MEENIKPVVDVLTTSVASSNCVHDSLPNNYITNQQVPPQERLQDKPQEDNILLQSSMQISNDQSERKESCTGEEEVEEQTSIFEITESVKTMQQGENENLPLSQPQKDIISVVNYNEQQEKVEEQETQNSNIKNGNDIAPASALTESTQNVVNNNDLVNNNKNQENIFQYFIKQSSMSGRGGATDSGHNNRSSGKAIIHLNVSLNQDVKLNEADNVWRPRVLGKSADAAAGDPEKKAQREKEELIRRVRGILNKLTPEKFETLLEEIIKLKIDTMDNIKAVVILVFQKAIDEPNFLVSYARLCQRLILEVKSRDERMESGRKSNLTSFRSALLDKTEREFTENVTKSSAKEEKLKPLKEQISNCTDPNEKVELEALLDEEDGKIRRRSGGTVRFIGELFQLSILTGRIIYTCIEDLLKDPNNEDMLEWLCKLLTTVGKKFEQANVFKDDNRKYSLELVINRMQNIASKNENSKISPRVRFMLQDVIDLRKKNWQSTRNEAPKTMQQIEKEANNEQMSSTYHYMNSLPSGVASSNKRDDRGGRSDGRNYGGSHSQRGDDTGSLKRQQGGIGSSHSQSGNSNNDDTWHVQTGKGNRSLLVDSSKLVGMDLKSIEFLKGEEIGTRPAKKPKPNTYSMLPSLSKGFQSNKLTMPKSASKYNDALDEAREMQKALVDQLKRIENQNNEILGKLNVILSFNSTLPK